MIMFVDREYEMDKLMGIAKSKNAELVLIYGRRRIGKSRLLVEFSKKVDTLYLLADVSRNILDILPNQIRDEFVKFNTWDDFFEFVYKSKYKIIIIDEFQYLYYVNKAWPSMLQRWWEKIKDTDKKIILCGSIISAIYKISKGYDSALYGRKTAEIDMAPLKFKFLRNFFPKYDMDELIKAYSVVGGIPRYIEEFDPKLSVEENIKRKIIERTGFLYNEPLNLLFEEFREPSAYVSILLAITQGYTRFNEISSISRIDGNKLPKYLLVLERVKIIQKDIPVTEKKIKSKTTKYKISDNFYKFWFRFVFKNKSMIEQGLEKEVFDSIKKELNAYFSQTFEDVCKEIIIDTRFFPVTKIGTWWHKDKEIDIVALNEDTKEIFFAECKWKEKVNAKKVLHELEEKAGHVPWNNDKRKVHYAIFSKSFSKRIDEFGGKKVFCFDLRDLEMVYRDREG